VTQYLTAQAAVGGNPAQLRAESAVLNRAVEQSQDIARSLRRAAGASSDFWQGSAGDAYRTHAGTQVATLRRIGPPIGIASSAYADLGEALESAQGNAGAAMQKSVDIGMAPGDLVGRPWAVATFLLTNPDEIITVARLIYRVIAARSDANDARDEFVRRMGRVRGEISEVEGDRRGGGERDGRDGRDNRWDPDGRRGGRIRSDDIWRRTEGGDGDGHFSTDWAGRAILERYMLGGDDWVINDDPDWSRYMMNNEQLRGQLAGPVEDQASEALRRYLAGEGNRTSFNQTFPAEIQNGEGIVGYQYLHGTNQEVGGFNFSGNSTVQPRADGTYEVIIDGGYQWNDKIDPNPQYSTDRWKSTLAEVITLGQADPYDLHITWHSQTRVILDKDGNVVSASGYPAP
jgi:hypothetical protein